MTDQPINLRELRADLDHEPGYGDSWYLSPSTVRALIDAAEAAREYVSLGGDLYASRFALERALTKFTWTQP